jgi:hypothetical protein
VPAQSIDAQSDRAGTPTTTRQHQKQEQQMSRTTTVFTALILTAALTFSIAHALPGKPDFAPHIYADGVMWGTKVTAMLNGPNGHNDQSFDKLFVITNSNNPGDQLPVGEAAPGNPAFNGGRWWTHTVEWTSEGFSYHGTVPILMSYDDIMMYESMGHLTITEGTPGPPPPDYFLCPLLPVK